jgi:hypothetical protein
LFDRDNLSDLEREFYSTRKDYMEAVENTTGLLKMEGPIDLAAFQKQHATEQQAFKRYQTARSAFLRAIGAAA